MSMGVEAARGQPTTRCPGRGWRRGYLAESASGQSGRSLEGACCRGRLPTAADLPRLAVGGAYARSTPPGRGNRVEWKLSAAVPVRGGLWAHCSTAALRWRRELAAEQNAQLSEMTHGTRRGADLSGQELDVVQVLDNCVLDFPGHMGSAGRCSWASPSPLTTSSFFRRPPARWDPLPEGGGSTPPPEGIHAVVVRGAGRCRRPPLTPHHVRPPWRRHHGRMVPSCATGAYSPPPAQTLVPNAGHPARGVFSDDGVGGCRRRSSLGRGCGSLRPPSL